MTQITSFTRQGLTFDVLDQGPEDGPVVRLVGAVLAEQTDEWAEGRRYLGLDLLARCRMHLIPAPQEDTTTTTELPALTA